MDINLIRLEELSVLFSENIKDLNKLDKNKCILLNFYIELAIKYDCFNTFIPSNENTDPFKFLHWFLSDKEIISANDWLRRNNYWIFEYNSEDFGARINLLKIFEDMFIKTGKTPHIQGLILNFNINEDLKIKQLKYSTKKLRIEKNRLKKENQILEKQINSYQNILPLKEGVL